MKSAGILQKCSYRSVRAFGYSADKVTPNTLRMNSEKYRAFLCAYISKQRCNGVTEKPKVSREINDFK